MTWPCPWILLGLLPVVVAAKDLNAFKQFVEELLPTNKTQGMSMLRYDDEEWQAARDALMLPSTGTNRIQELSKEMQDSIERRLSVHCVPFVLTLLAPQAFSEYMDCVETGIASADLQIAGAEVGVRATCWCQHGMSQVIDRFGCCEHPNFAQECAMQCDADCQSPAAQTCVRDCPALCFEPDYSFDGCSGCVSNNCHEYVRCITQHSETQTNAGNQAQICHTENFEESSQFRAYMNCRTQHPMRTNWNRYNSQHYCICEANLKAAAQQNSCCSAAWAESLCNDPCLTTQQCATQAATTCATNCRDTCTSIHPHDTTAICLSSCFADNSCNRYRTCEPLGFPTYEYVCDDGTGAKQNGCCDGELPNGQAAEVCPTLCENYRRYHIQGHGIECQCYNCPSSRNDAQVLANRTMYQEIYEHGQSSIQLLADQAQLDLVRHPWLSRKLQNMVQQRNDAILRTIESTGPLPSRQTQDALRRLQEDWLARMVAEVNRYKQEGPDNSLNPRVVDDDDDDDDGGGAVIIIAVAVGVAVVFIAIGVAAYVIVKTKAKGPANAPGVRPQDGDTNVVLGRPVDINSGQAAADGAPVAVGPKDVDVDTNPEKGAVV